jgi:signal transduction histidine kinase/CheY-like chemotaxis protein/HPt (histidine-containing phosphotransfer) domain-containing protein
MATVDPATLGEKWRRESRLLWLLDGGIFLLGLSLLVSALPVAPSRPPFVALGLLLGAIGTALLLWRFGRTQTALLAEAGRRRQAEQEARGADLVKSRVLAHVSHEIRTPLHGVLGMADLLLASELAAAQREQVEAIRTSAEALLALVGNVLDLSQIEAGRLVLRPSDFWLREVVGEVVRVLSPLAAKGGIELRVEISPEVVDHLHGDSVRLRQVLLNLVGNGVRFTRKGFVAIGMTARNDPGAAPFLRCEVRDTGVGIRPAVQARLFQPYARSDGSSSRALGGTGLGLVIAKEIVECMGGAIGFESTRGLGSTFWFEVPLVPARAEGPGALRRPAPREARILVVDDHPVNRAVAVAQLAALGYDAEAVDGGEAALAALAAGRYDAVLLDCRMPEPDGYETCRRLRQRHGRALPVIALTAYASAEEKASCLAAGMDDLLAKPFGSEELAAMLERWLGAEGLDACLAALKGLGDATGEEVLAPVIEAFLERGEEDLAAMRDAVARGDAEALAAAAHSLAGSSGVLGAAALAAGCAEIETLARQGETAAGAGRLAAVEVAYREVAKRLPR